MKENTKRNKHRADVEILDLLVKNPRKEFTTKEVEKEIGLAYAQTNTLLGTLRKHIQEKRPYAKYYHYGTIKNPITHIDQWIYKYDESK